MVEPKYLTFDEYEEMGGDLNESLFNSLEYQAENKINMYTFNRLINLEKVPNEVKACVFELIPLIHGNRTSILSEKIGDYSITRKSKTDIVNDTVDIIKTYLSNVEVNELPVLYIGVDED